jgi:hypothetical protein
MEAPDGPEIPSRKPLDAAENSGFLRFFAQGGATEGSDN